MGLVDLLTDLSNFRYTNYSEAGSVQSQVSGRHGTPDDPIDNTDFEAAFKELPKFKWYQPDGENDGAVESDSKKPRIE